MSEHLSQTESGHHEHEVTPKSEIQPPPAEKSPDAKNEAIDIQKTRERISEIHNPASASPHRSHQDDNSGSRAWRPNLESPAQSLTKKLAAIRANLSASENRLSRVIHNPLINSLSEATAKTLARPYAILAGGVVACAGSSLYMYYSRHLGYSYNFFVPVLLFFAGLITAIAVEVLYKTFQQRLKSRR